MTASHDSEHSRYAGDLAAYLLGALEGDERRAVAAHLDACARCRGEAEGLRGTVEALAVLRVRAPLDPAPESPTSGSPVPEDLLPSLLDRVRRERRRTRLLTTGAAAAALVVAVSIVLSVTLGPGGDGEDTPPARPMVAVAAGPVQASASIQAVSWGTRITLHCRYRAAAYPTTAIYRLRVTGVDGRTYDLGSWSLSPDRATTFTSGVSLAPDRVESVQVTTGDGAPLLRLDR